MKTNKHNLIAVLLTLAALAFGQTAQATVTQSIAFKGRAVNGNYIFIIGEPTPMYSSGLQSGTSVTFNNQTVVNQTNLHISINGTLIFAEANDYTNVTTDGTVTLTFDSPTSNSNPVPTWFYGAKVKNMAGVVQESSYSISNNRRAITVTIPNGTSFYYVELEQVTNPPMTNSNTTVTVPQGDYWVSDADHRPMPVPTVTYGNTTLTQGTDYTLSWSNNSHAGTGTVTVSGTGDYAGTATGTFSIRWATYTVHFDKNHNDATGTMNDQPFTYATSQNLTANGFARMGCTFYRWYTNPSGTGTSYTNGQLVNNLTPIDGETVTLYAKWTPITYNITYDLDGGSATNPATYNIETSTFTLNNPTRTGYTFAGWTGTDLTEATQTVTITQGSMGDRSYTAHWTDVWGVTNTPAADGSEEHPYLISDTMGLNLLSSCEIQNGEYFKLVSDISYSYAGLGETESNYTPIRVNQGGHFDGDSHIISGIRIYPYDNLHDDDKGLFRTNYGTVKNVTLTDAIITGDDYVGGIVGSNTENGLIENCHVTSTVIIKAYGDASYYHGGISGDNAGNVNKMPAIRNCTSAAILTNNGYENCGAYGGIVGENVGGIVSRCTAYGASVTATGDAGGIVGYNYRFSECETPVVENCFAIDCTINSGSAGAIISNSGYATLNNYYYNCTVNDNTTNIGTKDGDIAEMTNGAVTYYDGAAQVFTLTLGDDISASATVTVKYNSTDYYTAGTEVTLSYTGSVPEGYMVSYSYNDGTDHVVVGNSFTMPAADVTVSASVVPDFATWWHSDADHDGTTEGRAYIISTTTGLNLLASEVNGGNSFEGKFFKLGADIEYDPTNLVNGENYTAIGIYINPSLRTFSGIFDGDGHKVSGIRIHREACATYTARNKGLFGAVSNATIKNIILSDAQIYACSHVGGIVGNLISNNTIENCFVLNSQITATGDSTPFCGVITGNYTNDVTLTGNYYYNCSLTRYNTTYTNDIGTGGDPVTDRDGARSVCTLTLPYRVTASSAASVTINNVTYCVPNETVMLTPEPGITLSEVTVNGEPATDNGDDTWSFTMPTADAIVSATISGISTLQGDGSSANPYYIMDLLDWEVFTNWLNTPGTASYYSDKHYRLGADISVTTWAATNSDHPFCGTFDGNGHAIHVTFEQTGDQGVALFQYVGNGCDLHDLTVDGTINSNYQFAAGIVSVIKKGDNGRPNAVSINRCRSHVTFNLGVDGDATSGGLVALSQDNVMLTMQDCLFDGGYSSSTATHCSGMVGYQANNGFTYIENSYVSPNSMNLISNGNNRNFCRCGNSGNYKITNSYHTDPDFGDDQGEYVGASPDPYYVASLLGNWGVSGNQPVPTTVNMMIPNCTLFSGFDAHSCNTPYNNNGNNEESFTKLVDDNRSTKWRVSYTYSTSSGWQPISLDFSDTIPFAPKGYILTTGGDSKEHPDRLPKVWNLYGWNVSNNSWDLLDRREGGNDALPSLNCTDKLYLLKDYESQNTTYKKFKFEIEEITREDTVWDGVFHGWTPNTEDYVFELGEIRLLGVVSDADVHKLEHCFVNGILPSYDYTGAALSIDYRVTDCHYNLLVEGTHYTKSITRDNSIVNEIANVGVYTITFNGIAPYTGSKSISFAVIDPTATYSITLAGADHGSVSATATSNVAAGTEVLLDINPETTGYMLQSISATTASGNVEVDGGVWYSLNTDQASFTMPAADVTVTPTFVAINDLSVNMPADISNPNNAMMVAIPDGVTSFKVYDDGGPNVPSSPNSNGVMHITADLNSSLLEFSGSVDFGRLTLYNSTDFSDPIAVFDAEHPTINKVITTGNGALLCYIGNGYDAQKAGLNLTVKVLGNNGNYGVTIHNVTGGNVTIGGEATATKKVNDTVSLNVNVNSGYLCAGYTMMPDCRPVTGGVWHESPTEAYFVMPAETITITPNFTSTLTAAGGLYINMPTFNKCQPKTVNIPSGVSSFKVCDDGGASGNYSRYSDGVLVLTAPEGYHLKLSGTVTCHNEGIAPDYLKVFDGDAITAAPLGNPYGLGNSNGQNIGTLTSIGRSMTLYFHSGDHALSGLNLLVEVTNTFDASYAITFDDTNVPTNCSIVIPSSGSVGQTITANVTCDANHLLNAFSVTDAAGNEVALSEGLCWHNGNNDAATFTMLPRNLFVNYEFVEKGNQYIKIPKSDTLVVTVPEGITTFKIYDDGGPDANYSNGCDGYLLLTAPDGKVWQLTGRVKSEYFSDYMVPYDGATTARLIDFFHYGKNTGDGEDIGGLVTFSNQMLIHFYSDYLVNYEGLDLTAEIIEPIAKTVEGYASAPAGQSRWTFISAPMKYHIFPENVAKLIPETSGIIDPTSSHYDLYRFNQSAELEWENYKSHPNDFILDAGQGYLYANMYTKTIQFGGAVNINDSKTVPLAYDATSKLPGCNLVGNPLTTSAYVDRPYYRMDEWGSDVEIVENYAETPIPVCTGVVVCAEKENEVVRFSKTKPDHSTGNNGSLQMTLSKAGTRGANYQDKAIVSFNEGIQLGKFYFGEQDANIYIPQDGKEYAIVSIDGRDAARHVTTEIPVNFKAKKNGEYTLTVSSPLTSHLSSLTYLHLIDNLTGSDIDLLVTPSYTFTARNDDYASRFKLVFNANENDNQNENEDFAFISDGEIIINGEGTLQVIDLLGRQLFTREANSTFRIPNSAFPAGVYVLRLVNGENMKTQKIVIK